MVTEIAAGLYSSYVRTNDDKAYAWGANDRGEPVVPLLTIGTSLGFLYMSSSSTPAAIRPN